MYVAMTRPLADAAAILLILESCLLGLLPLALLAGMAYGATRLTAALGPLLKRAQAFSAQAAKRSEAFSHQVARPFIDISSRAAAARAWWGHISQPFLRWRSQR
ncbi:MAG: hypothetical protein C4310_05870 [Chloroflexota bacterium]